MTTAYADPRPVSGSLQQPEVDSAALNDVLADAGWGVQAVNWVFEAVTGESLVATIITPITGDWSKIKADSDAWRNVGNAMNDMSYNLTDAVGKVRDHWDGEAASAHERYIALGWKAGLLAEMGVAQLIAKGFDAVASGAEALGKQAARLLDYLVKKLLEAAATVWIPVAGWIKAAEQVWNAYQIYQRVMDIIETVKKLISDVKALFDAVGRVASAIGKLKDADSLAEAMNATQEVAEGVRDVRNSVNDIKGDVSSIKDSAKEIGQRGREVGAAVREATTPAGAGTEDGTKPAAASTPAPAAPAEPPTVKGDGTTTPSGVTTPAGTAGTDSTPSHHQTAPDTRTAAPHDTTPATTAATAAATTNGDHGGAGTGGSTDPTPAHHRPQFGADAIAANGQSYQQQLETILPNQTDRDRYTELSQKYSHELSDTEAQHVAEVRNQIKVENNHIMTKVLSESAVNGYVNDGWNTVQNSVARGVDVQDLRTPQQLRDGLALDDGGAGWSPIKENAGHAMQLRWVAGTAGPDMPVPFGGVSGAQYDDAAQRMADAGGNSTPARNDAPFTGTGSTGGGKPEWLAPQNSSLGDRAEIWRMNQDGTEDLHAVYVDGVGWAKI